jgi:hypothetical protein
MDYRTFCDNKGCRKEVRPVVDKKTLIAYCTECDQPITTITMFMRRQLVAEGQIKQDVQKKLAWSVKCPKCSKEAPPSLSKDENKLLCSFCKTELDHLNKPFAQSILVNLRAKKNSES